MFSTLRRRILTPSGAIAVVALVLALGGTAFAAAKLNGTQKKEVEKIAKRYAGKAGATGAVGATGPAGPAGAAGKNGAAGKEGSKGDEGSPWTDGGTLPSGSTETGTYNVRSTSSASGEDRTTAISFPIQLPSSLSPNNRHFIELGELLPAEQCEGSPEEPTAAPGYLCIYEGKALFGYKGGLHFITAIGTASFEIEKAGAELIFQTDTPTTVGEEVSAEGTWAVTAP